MTLIIPTPLKGYCLWFMPTGELYRGLYGQIQSIRTQYESPLFKPHVTLIEQVDGPEEQMLATAKQIACSLKPFDINFGKLGSTDSYYKALFIRAEKTDELMKANMAARKAYGRLLRSEERRVG